jgi:hypothetical protein
VGRRRPTPLPLCISRARLAPRKTLPRAAGPVLIDSAGFSELDPDDDQDGYTDWSITPRQHVQEARRYVEEIGRSTDEDEAGVVAIAPMDWMTERHILDATGLTCTEHLSRSVLSVLELRWLDPTLPFFPVVQGNNVDAYRRCADMFDRAGIDLTAEPIVGVGSVCRLQSTAKIVDVFAALHHHFGGNIRLHGFGVKKLGLARVAPGVLSADSMAGSRRGRSAGPCVHGSGAVSEANCPHFALDYYAGVLDAAARTTPAQWRATVDAYARRGTTAGLFEVTEVEDGPNMPTRGEAIARAGRVFLPEGAEAPLAGMLDDFMRRAACGNSDRDTLRR